MRKEWAASSVLALSQRSGRLWALHLWGSCQQHYQHISVHTSFPACVVLLQDTAQLQGRQGHHQRWTDLAHLRSALVHSTVHRAQ